MSGRLALLALCATVVLAAPASAQGPLPVPLPGLGTQPPSEQPPPSDQPQRPPEQPPRAPGGPSAGAGEVGDYFGAGGARSMPDDAVFGPLTRLWARRFEQHLSIPLLVRGKLILNVAESSSGTAGRAESRVVAFDVRTGRELWSRDTPGTYNTAHVASDGERVVSLDQDGVLRAFAVADGAPLWQRGLAREEDSGFGGDLPAIGGGVVLGRVDERVVAVRATDGAPLWDRDLGAPGDRGLLGARTYIAGDRVFLVGLCGRAAALEASTGRELWRSRGEEECSSRAPSILVGDRVYASPHILDAATGAIVGRVPFDGWSALAGNQAFGNDPVGANELSTGRRQWTMRGAIYARGGYLGPVVVGPTVYIAGADKVRGLLATSGTLRSETPIVDNSLSAIGGPISGLSAGQGVLAVAHEGGLTVLTGVLRPRPNGTDAAAARYQLVTGQRTVLAGGVGTALAGRRVRLQADRFPYGRWRRAGGGRVAADRTLYLRRRVTRNTRFRFAVRGARGRRGRITVYARPKLRTRIVAPSPRRVVVRAAVLGPRDMPAAGRRLVVYLGDTRRDRVRRLGTGVLRRTGRGRFSTAVGFRAPANVGSDDVFVFCVRGLARRGFGFADRFERRCGARRQRVRLTPPS